MKRLNLLLLLVVGLIFGACGTNIEDDGYDEVYDLWKYMTPINSYDVEYAVYENGQERDYFFETIKVFSSGIVERVSGDDKTTMTPYESSIIMEEPNGNIVQIQRYIKIGDDDIFRSSSIKSCQADDYFRNIVIKGYEFYNVIKISCQTNNGSSETYYGYREGIVSMKYRNEQGITTEILKVGERQLQ